MRHMSDQEWAEGAYAAGLINEHEYLRLLGYDDPDAELERRERLKIDARVEPVRANIAEMLREIALDFDPREMFNEDGTFKVLKAVSVERDDASG